MYSYLKELFARDRAQALILGLLLLFTLGNYLTSGLYAGLKYKGQDFVGYYANGKMMVQGVNIHDDQARQEALMKLGMTRDGQPLYRATRADYPPFWYLLMSVFSSLPWQEAFVLWTLINQVFLLLLILFIFSYFDIKLDSLTAFLGLFLMLNYFPLFYTLMEGQVNIFLFMLIMLGLWFFKRRNDWAAGLLLGLATGIKIVPAILLFYFLWKGHWKVVIFGLLGFLATLLATALGAGAGIVVSYYTGQLLRYGANPNADLFNQSLNGFWARLLMGGKGLDGLVDGSALANAVIKLSSVLVFLVSLAFTRGRSERCSLKWNLGMGIFILTMMLISAWTLEHHFIMLYFLWLLIFISYARGQEIRQITALIFMFCWIIIALRISFVSDRFNSGPLILVQSLKFYPLVLMWGLLLHELRRIKALKPAH